MLIRTALIPRRILMCIVLIIACATLGACTNTNRIGYKFLDWYLYWKIERFVSLDKEQKKATKKALKTFHTWHRYTQLPLYANHVKNLQERIQTGSFTGADIHNETDIIQDLMDLSLERLLPPAAPISSTLTNKQVIEIIKNIDEERQEFVEEYIDISDKKRLKQRKKDLRNFFKPWFGSFNKEQEQLAKDWAAALEPFEQLSAVQQEQWRNEIKKLLDNRADQVAFQKGMKGLMFYRTDNWHPELEAVLDRNQARSYQLVADLLNALTDKQKNKLLRRLAGIQEDFLYLATRKPPPKDLQPKNQRQPTPTTTIQ